MYTLGSGLVSPCMVCNHLFSILSPNHHFWSQHVLLSNVSLKHNPYLDLAKKKHGTRHLLHRRLFNAALQEQLFAIRVRPGSPGPAAQGPGRAHVAQRPKQERRVASPARSSAFKPKRVSHLALDWTRPRPRVPGGGRPHDTRAARAGARAARSPRGGRV